MGAGNGTERVSSHRCNTKAYIHHKYTYTHMHVHPHRYQHQYPQHISTQAQIHTEDHDPDTLRPTYTQTHAYAHTWALAYPHAQHCAGVCRPGLASQASRCWLEDLLQMENISRKLTRGNARKMEEAGTSCTCSSTTERKPFLGKMKHNRHRPHRQVYSGVLGSHKMGQFIANSCLARSDHLLQLTYV